MRKLLYSIDSLSSSVCMSAVLGQYPLRSATARFAPMGSIRPGSTSQFPDNLGNGVNDSNSRGARCLRVALGNGCGVISCVSLHLFARGACGLVSGVAAIRWGSRTLIIEIEPACKERIAQNYAMRVGVCASAWGWRHVRQAACRRATWI